MTRVLAALLFLLLSLTTTAAWAHKPSDALLRITLEPAPSLRWEVALRDLELSPGGLDDGDGQLHRSELEAHAPALFAAQAEHLRFSVEAQPCRLEPLVPLEVTEHSDGAYAALSAQIQCDTAGALSFDYDYLFALDPQHRLIVQLDGQTHVLSRDDHQLRLDARAPPPRRQLFLSGVTHILEGADHLLFLLSLLLPAVLIRRGAASTPAASFRPVLAEVLRVVTAFTVAHSLTLSLAVLGLATLPARLVEPAIAASVIVAALANVRRPSQRDWFGGARWPIAYTLGLLHGYGFSSALTDAGLRGGDVALPLFTFNLGVEAGQLAVVALLLPLLFVLRRWSRYETVILRGASVLVAWIASVWLVERAFDVELLRGGIARVLG